MEWQLIETAPKDGTHVLVFMYGDMTTAYWDGETWELSIASDGPVESNEVNPTHWMPLPTPPNVKVRG